jgi:hypothetical protein
MDIAKFAPDVLIEIDDALQGFRKLGVVTESGQAYIDLAESDATPFPIYQALSPIAVGDPLGWAFEIMDRRPAEFGAYSALQKSLLAAGVDSLTYYRALYWACQAGEYDSTKCLQAGQSATEQVRQSRQQMDNILKRGRTTHLTLVKA